MPILSVEMALSGHHTNYLDTWPRSAAYGVAQRIFSLPVLMAGTVNYPQWSVMAQVDAAGDHAIVTRMFRHTLATGSGAASLVLVAAALAY